MFDATIKPSGKVRMLAIGASIRIMIRRTIEILHEISSELRFGDVIRPCDRIVRCTWYCCSVTEEKDATKIMDK